ncbi:hypothetical protein [Kribbella qitaiheensis]|uniref:hypothetical protein n=1 Tax=Kribbella qitaiheensis TaxID=1544730 RepID=UPI001FE706F6|nr:hypothetical protein [Kribbella qitaiheensis]
MTNRIRVTVTLASPKGIFSPMVPWTVTRGRVVVDLVDIDQPGQSAEQDEQDADEHGGGTVELHFFSVLVVAGMRMTASATSLCQ